MTILHVLKTGNQNHQQQKRQFILQKAAINYLFCWREKNVEIVLKNEKIVIVFFL